MQLNIAELVITTVLYYLNSNLHIKVYNSIFGVDELLELPVLIVLVEFDEAGQQQRGVVLGGQPLPVQFLQVKG